MGDGLGRIEDVQVVDLSALQARSTDASYSSVAVTDYLVEILGRAQAYESVEIARLFALAYLCEHLRGVPIATDFEVEETRVFSWRATQSLYVLFGAGTVRTAWPLVYFTFLASDGVVI